MLSNNVEIIAEFLKLDARKGFGEDIGSHAIGWDIDQVDVARGDGLTNEMEMNVNVFGTAMESGVLGQMNGALIVTVKSCW